MHATHLTDELGRFVVRSQNFLVQSRGILILQTRTALHGIQSGANAWPMHYETQLGPTASLPTFQSSKGKYPQTSAKRITPQLHHKGVAPEQVSHCRIMSEEEQCMHACSIHAKLRFAHNCDLVLT
jgi:hypothetical protein